MFARQENVSVKNIKWYNHKQHKGLVLVLLQFVGPAASLDNGQISHELRWLKRELGADWAFIVIGSTPTVTRETRQYSPGSQRAQDLFVRVITTALYLISQKKYQIFDHDYYCALQRSCLVTWLWHNVKSGAYKLFFYLFIPFKQKLCIGFWFFTYS